MKRFIKYLPFLFLFLSCGKDDGSSTADSSVTSYTEQEWNWNKQMCGDFLIDTTSNGDSIIIEFYHR